MANEVWGGGVIANIKLHKVMIDTASRVIVLHWELGLCHEDISNYSGVGRTIRRAQGEEGGQRNGGQEGRGYFHLYATVTVFERKKSERRPLTSSILLQAVHLLLVVEGIGRNLSGKAELMRDGHWDLSAARFGVTGTSRADAIVFTKPEIYH